MSNNIMGLLGAVILVVLGVEFGDEIVTACAGLLNGEYIDDFLGLNIVGQILPTVYYVSLVSFAGAIGYKSAKGIGGQVG